MVEKLLRSFSDRLSTWMEIIAGAALIGIMLLTGADILLRIFGHPIPGTYEVVSFAGGLVIGLALPVTSKAKGHVSTDLLMGKISGRKRYFLILITRLIGIFTFSLVGYSMIMMGIRLRASGEVTAVLALPFYYVAFALGGAFFVQTLILILEMAEAKAGRDE